jgi:conjugal transfer pilus assembly protein TraE
MILGFVPSAERDVLKKALDIEAERIRKRASPPSSTRKKFASWMMAPCSTAGSEILHHNGAIITPLKDQEKTYRLKLSYDNGVINLHSFEELQPVSSTN